MKTIVCVKGISIPKIGNNNIDDEYKVGTKDMYALKTALALKKKYSSKVEIICMAPSSVCGVLKQWYIYDIDQIYLISDRVFAGADTFITSFVLHETIKKIGMADIILCGKSSDDSGTAQVGPSLAERLNCQLISDMSSVEGIYDHNIKCESNSENVKYLIETRLPIVGTIDCPPKDRRYPSLKNIIGCKKDVTLLSAEDLGISKSQIQSKTKVLKLFPYEKEKKGEIIQGDMSDKVSRFFGIIKLYR